MKIAVGCDHGAVACKGPVLDRLAELGHEAVDFGTFDEASVDYPDIAALVAPKVAAGEFDCGILMCGTGIGMSIAANKYVGVRASLCHDTYSARLTRQHNNSNILCLGGRVIGPGPLLDIVQAYLEASFEGGRHQRRLDKLAEKAE